MSDKSHSVKNDLEEILEKWDESREKVSILEERIKKYKTIIAKEMDSKKTDQLRIGKFTVSRRHNTRDVLSKDSVPINVWKQYATKCSYDAFFLTKK